MRRALQAPKLRDEVVADSNVGTKPAPENKQPASGPGVEFRGNPIYSPNDSLAKAASKLANLKAPSNAAATTGKSATQSAAVETSNASKQSSKPRLSDAAATPGYRPEGNYRSTGGGGAAGGGGDDEVPLAARSLITKRNRRKSVYQRPTRYGDWFDGDDDELEKMVDKFNDDEDGEKAIEAAAAVAQAEKKREQKDRAARRKSAFPALALRESIALHRKEEEEEEKAEEEAKKETVVDLTAPTAAAAAAAASPSEIGTDIANKVRAIADGLCDRLDGLIEESPALARGAKRDDKSLRDKLLESWEGRVSLFTKRAFLSSLFLPSFLPSFLPHINTLTTTSPKHPTYHSIYYKNFTFYN